MSIPLPYELLLKDASNDIISACERFRDAVTGAVKSDEWGDESVEKMYDVIVKGAEIEYILRKFR